MNDKTDLSNTNIALSDAEREALAEAEADGDTALGTVEDADVVDEPSGAPLEGEKAAVKAGDEKPADEKPADEKPADDKAADDKPADLPPVAAAVEEVVPPLRLPEIAVKALPTDLDAQFSKIESDQKDLDKKLDEGEIEAKEYTRESRKLGDRRQELKDVQSEYGITTRTNQAAREAAWNNAQQTFYDKRSDFRNPILAGALDASLRALYVNPKYAGADFAWLLSKAAEEVDKATGKTAAAAPTTAVADAKPAAGKPATPAVEKQQQRIAQATADRKVVPQTLGGLPAAGADSPGSGEFSHLDNLAGMELEQALSRMPAEAAERYLNS